MQEKEDTFYLIRSDFLPESMRKTLEAKQLLDRGKVNSVYEAVKQVDLSRSAFYKYRDAVFPFKTVVQERIITLFIHLEDQAGALSKLLTTVAGAGGNILTIHQTIPIQDKANVTLSLDVQQMQVPIEQLMKKIKELSFIEKIEIVSSGA
ncbi:ACT domain-containing protein [Paraliobacillus salinarum]|uniref:ACT domain-containing protein n=1 Tax=Paraliobacillus salinarum TaxID=1158996 RepID=UPI0015F5ED82|nr:ACT domain-containing protein [Paraliobacillus salinarum]